MNVTNNEITTENSRGGARPGAGRPKLEDPRKAHSFSCTDREAEIIKKVLAFLRAYPSLVRKQEDQPSTSELKSASTGTKKCAQSLQWLESEEETGLNHTIKKVCSPNQTNLQWLESEAEQELAVAAEPWVRKSVLEAAKGLANIMAEKF